MLLFLACAGPDSADTGTPKDTADTGDTTFTWGEAPLPTAVIGWIEAVEQPAQSYARLAVELWSGALPTTQVVVAQDGDCTLLQGATMNDWDCDPACDYGTQACIDGTCVDYPSLAPSGEITVAGLTPGDVTLEAGAGRYGIPAGYTGELFEAGDPVHVTSTGGDTPALDLSAVGVESLVMPEDPPSIEPGMDLELAWSPPSADGPARIQVMLETGWHGSPSLTTIWCETEDDGALTVPASLTTEFPIPSCGECEASTITRFTRDVVDFGQGPVQLFVGSERSFVAWW